MGEGEETKKREERQEERGKQSGEREQGGDRRESKGEIMNGLRDGEDERQAVRDRETDRQQERTAASRRPTVSVLSTVVGAAATNQHAGCRLAAGCKPDQHTTNTHRSTYLHTGLLILACGPRMMCCEGREKRTYSRVYAYMPGGQLCSAYRLHISDCRQPVTCRRWCTSARVRVRSCVNRQREARDIITVSRQHQAS